MTTNSKNPRRILINDDGWIMSETEPALAVRDLKEKMVDPYRNAPVDALLWCIGDREVYHYETQIGEVPIAGPDQNESHLRQARNVQSLVEESGGPLTALTGLCRDAGIDLFPSIRMNSHYAADPQAPSSGRFRKEHPELLIGRPGEEFATGSLEWGVRTGVDYAHADVRSHMLSVICELFERFDVDGIELDFMRHPTFFRPQDAYANRYLITDMLRYARQRRDAAAKARGRDIDITARVPPTLEDALRLGLDVRQWMSEGLVNIVIAGGGFLPFETPIRDFVEAAADSGCLVYGCIENLRPAVDDETIRGIASYFWAAGAAGIHLFNFFGKSPEWKRRVLAEIADPDKLKHLNKRYQMDGTRFRPGQHRHWSTRDLHDYAFQNAVPTAQLPVAIADTHAASGPTLRLHVADDVESASRSGALSLATLTLSFDGLRGEDEIEVRLNGDVLSTASCTTSFASWNRLEWTGFPTRLKEVAHDGGTMRFDLSCPPLRSGINEIEVRLIRRTVQKADLLVLVDVEVALEYA